MEPNPADPPRSFAKTLIRIAAIVAFAFVIHQLLNWLNQQIAAQGSQTSKFMFTSLILLILLVYALLIAIPFVPGIEIGLSLMLLQGPEIAPLVYVFTVLGLSLSYLAGRFLPYSYVKRVLSELGLRRASRLIDRIQPLSTRQRLDFLQQKLPRFIAPVFVQWRYVVLGLSLSVPGNSVIGGGGGICLLAGLTRLFTPGWALLTLAISVAPFPLLVYFMWDDVALKLGNLAG
ncbi:MAG: hypothetical protein GY947_12055 [Rhodobacteraceae bacterium]|nr:hypothetical protein [Paracoccaceae bacterium]